MPGNIVPIFKLNPEVQKQFRKACDHLAAVAGKDDPESLQKLVRLSARRFVQNVVDVTPPASGKADAAAKAKGEDAILNDLMRLAVPVTVDGVSRKKAREILTSAEQLMELYLSSRSSSTGRVNPGRRQRVAVDAREFNAVLKRIQLHVGWLAAGLNAAARELGAKLPAWVKRHGEHFGKIEIKADAKGIHIRIVQNVPYTDNIKQYERQWNFALKKEVSSLQNQAAAIVKKRARQAGFRLK